MFKEKVRKVRSFMEDMPVVVLALYIGLLVCLLVVNCPSQASADPVEPRNHKDNVIELPRPDWLPGFDDFDEELQTEQSREEVVQEVVNRWREDQSFRLLTFGGGGGHGKDKDKDKDKDVTCVPEGSTFMLMGLGLCGIAIKGRKN